VLVGCLPEPLPVKNISLAEKTVVIGSQNVPGEFLAVSLTENFNAFFGGDESEIDLLLQELLIDSLEVEIEVAGDNYLLDNAEPGLYLGTDIPKITGELYTLNFVNPYNDYPVTATTPLLPAVRFDSIAVSIQETQFDTLVNVSLKLTDPTGPNWYMFNVQLFNEDFDKQETPFTELLDDSDFDSSEIEYDFVVFFRDYVEGDSIFVSMANISEDYYDFLTLRKEQRFLLLDGLGEPVNYPTNVENGFGFFHMHIRDVRIFGID
jgi:hypothetical protein